MNQFSPIKVDLGPSSYNIFFNRDWAGLIKSLTTKKPMIITEENVAGYHLDHWKRIIPEAEIIIVPPGEQSKSYPVLERIHTELIEKGLSRDTVIFALGGGMIGDLAGFAAASYMRGVDLIQIPTTLLAMVDASIGGKTGINHKLGKNLIGAFWQPKAVLIDFRHLNTLPEREWLCGIGEMLKYGIIRDKELFANLSERISISGKPQDWIIIEMVKRCAEIKAEIVSQDERESGVRALLNFGHTIGHGLEAAGDYNLFRHGEAVIAGIAGAAYLSRKKCGLPQDDYTQIMRTIGRIPLPPIPREITASVIFEIMKHDKKIKSGKFRFILTEAIGAAHIDDSIEDSEIFNSIDFTLDFINNNADIIE
ncbi:3-dehydroquinate synthase [bacterium]|nr:3-dehydroquinate synthase [bacterium]